MIEQESSGFTVWTLMQAIPICWLHSTLYNPVWPPIMARCSIIFAFFKRSLEHFASKSPKANIRLIKKALPNCCLNLAVGTVEGFQKDDAGESGAYRPYHCYPSLWQVAPQVAFWFLLWVTIIVNFFTFLQE